MRDSLDHVEEENADEDDRNECQHGNHSNLP
jgi:hypothetical protein